MATLFTEHGFVVSDDVVTRWTAAYPALDVSVEIRQAYEWARANPARKKHNWERFLVNWLKRSQDHAGRFPPTRSAPTLEERKARTMEQLRQMRAEGRL